jgi:hypothetical protein
MALILKGLKPQQQPAKLLLNSIFSEIANIAKKQKRLVPPSLLSLSEFCLSFE